MGRKCHVDSIILYLLRDGVFEINTTQQNTSKLNLTQSNILLIFQKNILTSQMFRLSLTKWQVFKTHYYLSTLDKVMLLSLAGKQLFLYIVLFPTYLLELLFWSFVSNNVFANFPKHRFPDDIHGAMSHISEFHILRSG